CLRLGWTRKNFFKRRKRRIRVEQSIFIHSAVFYSSSIRACAMSLPDTTETHVQEDKDKNIDAKEDKEKPQEDTDEPELKCDYPESCIDAVVKTKISRNGKSRTRSVIPKSRCKMHPVGARVGIYWLLHGVVAEGIIQKAFPKKGYKILI